MIIYYKNKTYDISGFVEKHPGGSHVLKNVHNQDITSLVHSYHKNVPLVEKTLHNFLISSIPPL